MLGLGTLHKLQRYGMSSEPMAKDVLYIGIDLGTFRSVMVSSDSHEVEELTVIGTPKDAIAKNFLKRDVLFGNEALKNRLALNLYRPLELGVIKDTPEDREYIAHFITHLIGLSDPEEYDRVVAVIGAPAEASHVDKTAIFDAAAGSVNSAMIISEPFAVAYALDMINHTLVIDVEGGIRPATYEEIEDDDPRIRGIREGEPLATMPRRLNLNNLTFHLPFDKVEYEPEQFPGLIYRLDYPRVVCLIFGSGKMVITGARDKSEILEAVQFIQDELADLL